MKKGKCLICRQKKELTPSGLCANCWELFDNFSNSPLRGPGWNSKNTGKVKKEKLPTLSREWVQMKEKEEVWDAK